MFHYVGLDVSVKLTSLCIMDPHGSVVHEAKVTTDPEDIALYLADADLSFGKIGLEAGPLSQWVYAGLAKAGFPVFCIETRHAKAILSANPIKTDRNDARGIANIMRANLYKEVHVKTIESQRIRAVLNSRRVLQTKMQDIEATIRGLLRNFGMKVGTVSRGRFEERVRELTMNDSLLYEGISSLLTAHAALRTEEVLLKRKITKIAREDEVCRRLMTAPGVGPIVALTFKTAVDVPERFKKSKAVGTQFGLAPRKYQSGTIDVTGGITKYGDPEVRWALYEAAVTLMRPYQMRHSWLRAWGLELAKRRGRQKAIVAVSRRLATILHRMWVSGTDYQWGDGPPPNPNSVPR